MLLIELSEATAARRRIPLHLVDATDGITPETGESGGQPQLSKAGAAFANTTATLTAVGNGLYYVELTASEVDTVGFGVVRYKSAATAECQVVFQVISFDPYDATRLGLAALPNAAAEAAGGLYTRGSGAGQINQDSNGRIDARAVAVTDKTGYSLTATEEDTITDKVWDELAVDHVIAGSFGQANHIFESGLAQAGGAATITLRSGAPATNNLFDNMWVILTAGTGAKQAALIIDYDGTTKVATVRETWNIVPSSDTQYAIVISGPVDVAQWRSGIPNVLISGRVDASAEILGTTAKADVKAEVVSALNTDTYAEPGQGTPPATTTLVQRIGYLYKALRNRHRQSTTVFELYNDDAVTVDQKAAVSDDGTTFERGEITTGP